MSQQRLRITGAETVIILFPSYDYMEAFLLFFLFYFCKFFLRLFLRQRQIMNGGGSEREGDTESETSSRL